MCYIIKYKYFTFALDLPVAFCGVKAGFPWEVWTNGLAASLLRSDDDEPEARARSRSVIQFWFVLKVIRALSICTYDCYWTDWVE